MKIWVLFSIANDYDQPEANLEAWWETKPTFRELAKILDIKVILKEGNALVGRIFKGEEIRIGETDYRLEEIKSGVYKRK